MTLDSLFAVVLVLFILFVFSFYHFNIPATEKIYFERIHFSAEDAMQVLDNKGVLEQIARYWAKGNLTLANETASRNLDDILPERFGYRLMVGSTKISSRPASSSTGLVYESAASDKVQATRMVSGYRTNSTWVGYMARALLLWNRSNITTELSYTPHGIRREVLNITFDDHRYADPNKPNFRENKTLWLTLPMGATVTEAHLNISAGGY